MDPISGVAGLVGLFMQQQSAREAADLSRQGLDLQRQGLADAKTNAAAQLKQSQAGRTDVYGNTTSFDDALNQWITQLTPSQRALVSGSEQLQAGEQKLSTSDQDIRALAQKLAPAGINLQAGEQGLSATDQLIRQMMQQLAPKDVALRSGEQDLTAGDQSIRALLQSLAPKDVALKSGAQDISATDQVIRQLMQGTAPADVALREGEQKITARDQQLRQLMQTLGFTDQQLKAGEQGLGFTDQELRRTEQGLSSRDQALRSGEQDLFAKDQTLRGDQQGLFKIGQNEQYKNITEDAGRNRTIRENQFKRGLATGDEFNRLLSGYKYDQPASEESTRADIADLIRQSMATGDNAVGALADRQFIRQNGNMPIVNAGGGGGPTAGKQYADIMLQARSAALDETMKRSSAHDSKYLPAMSQMAGYSDQGLTPVNMPSAPGVMAPGPLTSQVKQTGSYTPTTFQTGYVPSASSSGESGYAPSAYDPGSGYKPSTYNPATGYTPSAPSSGSLNYGSSADDSQNAMAQAIQAAMASGQAGTNAAYGQVNTASKDAVKAVGDTAPDLKGIASLIAAINRTGTKPGVKLQPVDIGSATQAGSSYDVSPKMTQAWDFGGL